MLLCLLLVALPATEAAVPGTFFWRPNVGLDLGVATGGPKVELKPTGFIVVIRGYDVGVTVVALAAFANDVPEFPHLSPTSASFYTNAYRWVLRHLSLLPGWLSEPDIKYSDTHKVWNKRYFYMDKFTPQWLRSILFFVDKDEWKKEEDEWPRFEKYAEPAFGKHYRHPSLTPFDDYNSFRDKDSVENLDHSSESKPTA